MELVIRLLAILVDKMRTGAAILLILLLTRRMGRKAMFSVFFTRNWGGVLSGLDLFEAFKMLFIRPVFKPLLMFLHEGEASISKSRIKN